jgi:radical SAM superfamily enzyme YgiQ (UPF0313 family)
LDRQIYIFVGQGNKWRQNLESKMKIKLILAADKNDPLRKNNPFKPLSLLLLAAAAPDHHYELVDMLDTQEIDFDSDVDVVGISIRKSAESTGFEVADKFKQKHVKVILGGPQVSAIPIEARKHADAVVIGEGEILWPKLLEDLESDHLKDFYVSAPKKFLPNGYSVFQLEELPNLKKIPKLDRGLLSRKYDFELVFASRGCAINCDFCSVTRLFGSKYRLRPVDDVVKEIAEFKGYYYLIDDTIFGRPQTYDYYYELYDKIASLKKPRYWTGQANLDAASNEKGREIIQKAAKAGLIYAAIGMESINEVVLKKSGSYSKMGVSKANDLITKMKENIRFIQQQGILISAWFAIGYEDDSLETYKTTLQFCHEMNLIPVFTPVHALEGTDLYDRMEKEDKLQDNKSNVTNVTHPYLTNEQVIQELERANRKGFSLLEILKRTWFYMKIFIKQKQNKLGDIIHKTIFTFITQWRFRKIAILEAEKLKGKVQRNG